VLQYAKVLLVLDCNGAKKVKALYDATTIFIAPPSIEVLEQRLIRRSGSAEKRIIFAKDEMAQMHDFDHVVVNDNLSEAKEALLELLSI
jgi:guanylate kinase